MCLTENIVEQQDKITAMTVFQFAHTEQLPFGLHTMSHCLLSMRWMSFTCLKCWDMMASAASPYPAASFCPRLTNLPSAFFAFCTEDFSFRDVNL